MIRCPEARNRQELGQTLDGAEHRGLQQIHSPKTLARQATLHSLAGSAPTPCD